MRLEATATTTQYRSMNLKSPSQIWEGRASTGRCTLGEGATAKPSADIKPNVVRQAVEPLACASGLYCWAWISVLRKYEPEARASGLSAQRTTLKIHSLRGRVIEPSLNGIATKQATLRQNFATSFSVMHVCRTFRSQTSQVQYTDREPTQVREALGPFDLIPRKQCSDL